MNKSQDSLTKYFSSASKKEGAAESSKSSFMR